MNHGTALGADFRIGKQIVPPTYCKEIHALFCAFCSVPSASPPENRQSQTPAPVCSQVLYPSFRFVWRRNRCNFFLSVTSALSVGPASVSVPHFLFWSLIFSGENDYYLRAAFPIHFPIIMISWNPKKFQYFWNFLAIHESKFSVQAMFSQPLA